MTESNFKISIHNGTVNIVDDSTKTAVNNAITKINSTFSPETISSKVDWGMNEVKDDTETLLRWQSVGGGALPFNARAKRTRTSESPTCTKKIAKICNKKLPKPCQNRTGVNELYQTIKHVPNSFFEKLKIVSGKD